VTTPRARPRVAVAMLTAAAVALGGIMVGAIPREASPPAHEGVLAPSRQDSRVDALFRQGVAMLREHRHEQALGVFHELLVHAPRMPEAHVNMGYALLGLGRPVEAASSFQQATSLRPAQLNAYYGLAEALEASGDLRGALGAMRSYVHRAPADDAYRRRAQAAIWEWEARLGSTPSAPTVPTRANVANGRPVPR